MWRSQAEAEGLTLLAADNSTGYFGVGHKPGKSKPYLARVRRGGKQVSLGHFATAEEAALCFARSPEGQAAAKKAAAAPPLTSEEAQQQAEAPLQPSSPPPAPPATVRCTAPPPRQWRSSPASPACHRASPAPSRDWDSRH